MTIDGIQTIGIIGAGNIGGALAQALSEHGYEIVIANSRGPETLTELVAPLDGVRAATAAEAAEAGDVVVVTVPLKAVADIDPAPLAGKIVLDTNNYYWERDGRYPALDAGEATTSGLVQQHFADAKVVKAFNHIPAAAILTDGEPAGSATRRALGVASDHPEASALAAALYDQLGLDAVDLGGLDESWRIERDRPAYVIRQTAAELRANLALATRTV